MLTVMDFIKVYEESLKDGRLIPVKVEGEVAIDHQTRLYPPIQLAGQKIRISVKDKTVYEGEVLSHLIILTKPVDISALRIDVLMQS